MKSKTAKAVAFIAPLTAFFGSCCALPLLLLGLGVGSASFTAALTPYRPYLIGITLLLLCIAFYLVYGCKQTCNGEEGSCDAKSIQKTKILLWIVTGISLLFLVGPDIFARFLL